MKVSIHTNTQEPIGKLTGKLMKDASEVFVASAYISDPAVKILLGQINSGDNSLAKSVDLLFGFDLVTSASALDQIVKAAEERPGQIRARFVPHKSGRLFHPKVYFFRVSNLCHIIISSANLTLAGHSSNEEIYCHIECASNSQTAKELDTIRQAWMSDSYSGPLDVKLVTAKITFDEAQEALKRITVAAGVKIIADPPPPSPRQQFLAELAKGYLIDTDFSVAPLSVAVPIRQAPNVPAIDSLVPTSDGPVNIRTSLTASVKLLPDTVCDEFEKLYREANRIVETRSITLPSGVPYIPQTAQKTFASEINKVLDDHKSLLRKYIYLRTPITSHLKKLADNCAQQWDHYKDQPGVVTEAQFLQSAKARVAVRRKAFRDNNQSAVRLSITPYPHPLVYRELDPNHAAWDLYKTKAEDELLKTIVAILTAQINLIISATLMKQQPALQTYVKQAKLLIGIEAEIVKGLLAKLSAAARDWDKTRKNSRNKQKKVTPGQLIAEELTKIRVLAEKHKHWFEEKGKMSPEKAFDLLLTEYPHVGL